MKRKLSDIFYSHISIYFEKKRENEYFVLYLNNIFKQYGKCKMYIDIGFNPNYLSQFFYNIPNVSLI